MAPIGTLTTRLALEKNHIQGPDDPINGTISLTFHPNTTQHELFGPLHLRVILEGHMKLHVSENRTSHAYIFFDENRLLFNKAQDLLNGPIRLTAPKQESVPFQICFPNGADADGWSIRRENLPPTFKTRIQAAAALQYGKHQGAAEIEYSLRARADLLGIDVEVVNEAKTVMQYEQSSALPIPAGTDTREISQTLQVETYQLLPEDERPSSLMSKTKAILNNVPKPVFAFTATCFRIPESIAVGQSVEFDIRVQVDSKMSTTTIAPSISLADAKVGIVARTELYATNEEGVNSPRLNSSAVVHTLELRRQDPAGIFEKSSDYAKTLSFTALPLDVPRSFTMTKLSRSYTAQLELRFVVAERQSVAMRKQISLRVLSESTAQSAPPYTASTRGASRAGSSRLESGSASRDRHDELPLYEEAVGLARVP